MWRRANKTNNSLWELHHNRRSKQSSTWIYKDVFTVSVTRTTRTYMDILLFVTYTHIIMLYIYYTHIIMLYMTRFKNKVRSYCKSRKNLKMVKWGWNMWNGHILVYIYHKQCGIMQKIQWKSSISHSHSIIF